VVATGKTIRQRAGAAIVEALVAEQVEVVFGLVGSHVIEIYDALVDAPKIRHITVKHEGGASCMADAYGRLTGKPGVCIVTAGPGATNSLTGVAQAYMAASPLLHITGAVPTNGSRESFHGVDDPRFLMPMFEQVTKWNASVKDMRDIPAVMAKAFQIATSGRPGPVHIEIPQDVLTGDAIEMDSYTSLPPLVTDVERTALDQLAERIATSERPVIWAGKGVRATFADVELAELAELLEAPVILAGDAAGALPDSHPLAVGQPSLYAQTPFQRELLQDADLVIAIGERAQTTHADQLFSTTFAPVAGIWLGNPGDGPDERAVSGAVADIRSGLNQLIEALGAQQRSRDQQLRARIQHEKRGLPEATLAIARRAYANHRPMHYGLAIEALREMVDQDVICMGDIGQHNQWTRMVIETVNRDSYIPEGFWGAMGFGLPAAMAAKLAYPEKKALCVTGDGCFLMASAEFSTAVEYGLNPVVVILNDSQYGMIVGMQESTYGRISQTALDGPDFVAFARSFGGDGVRVERPEEMRAALERGFSSDVIFVIDAICDFRVPNYDLEAATRELRGEKGA
jgi:acetolactate synthase-1/2/3 large subunit